jgi:hypothetical protein
LAQLELDIFCGLWKSRGFLLRESVATLFLPWVLSLVCGSKFAATTTKIVKFSTSLLLNHQYQTIFHSLQETKFHFFLPSLWELSSGDNTFPLNWYMLSIEFLFPIDRDLVIESHETRFGFFALRTLASGLYRPRNASVRKIVRLQPSPRQDSKENNFPSILNSSDTLGSRADGRPIPEV